MKRIAILIFVALISTGIARAMEEKDNDKKKEQTITLVGQNNKKTEIRLSLAKKFKLLRDILVENENEDTINLSEEKEENIEIPIDAKDVDLAEFFEFVENWLKDSNITVDDERLVSYLVFANFLGNITSSNDNLLQWLADKIVQQIEIPESEDNWKKILKFLDPVPEDMKQYIIVPLLISKFSILFNPLIKKTESKLQETSLINTIIELNDNAILSASNNIIMWNIDKKSSIKNLKQVSQKGIWALAKITDGIFASADLDGVIKIWNVNSTKPKITINATDNNEAINTLIKLEQNNMVSIDFNGTIKIWDSSDGNNIKTIENIKISNSCKPILLKNGLMAFATKNNDKNLVIIYDIKNNEIKDTKEFLKLPKNIIQLMDETILIDDGDSFMIWDPTNNKSKNLKLEGFEKKDRYIVELKNGDLVLGYSSGKLCINDIKNGKLKLSFDYNKEITSLLSLTNGNLALSVEKDIFILSTNLLEKFTTIEQILVAIFLLEYYEKNKKLPDIENKYSYLIETYKTFDVEIRKAFAMLAPRSFMGNFYTKNTKK